MGGLVGGLPGALLGGSNVQCAHQQAVILTLPRAWLPAWLPALPARPPACLPVSLPAARSQIVSWLGLDGICGGPTLSWWPVKTQVSGGRQLHAFSCETR